MISSLMFLNNLDDRSFIVHGMYERINDLKKKIMFHNLNLKFIFNTVQNLVCKNNLSINNIINLC
jgi:hypothetical protein